MEGLRNRALILGIIFIVLGVAYQAIPQNRILHDGRVPDEEWLAKVTPKTISGFSYVEMAKMPKEVYDELKPYGIIVRGFENTYEKYDTVVIMSSNKASFHDPLVCFTSQGLKIQEQQVVEIPTQKHGKIKITFAQFVRDEQTYYAAFFYRGPRGFAPDSSDVKMQMFMHQFTTLKDSEGVFYRFMPLYQGNPETIKKNLFAFIDRFLSEADKTSGGLI